MEVKETETRERSILPPPQESDAGRSRAGNGIAFNAFTTLAERQQQ